MRGVKTDLSRCEELSMMVHRPPWRPNSQLLRRLSTAAKGERVQKLRESLAAEPAPQPILPGVKRKVVLLSGKGGVGKSTLAAQLAFSLSSRGLNKSGADAAKERYDSLTPRTGAKAAHDRGYTGAGVTVGIVDSGIFRFHPDLAGRLSPISMNGYDGGASDGIDAFGQGTHLAGIISANRNGTGMVGVAYGAQVSALQLTTRGSPTIDMSRIDFIAAGLFDHGRLNGIEFYNNAWGSTQTMPSSGTALDSVRHFFETDRSHTLAAIRRGVDAGSIYVWSAGDNGDASVKLEAGLPHLYPELKGHWMAVTAVGQTGEITAYSNRCGLAATWCISAPGGDDDISSGGIYSTSNSTGYQRKSGTAQASAHVAAACAALCCELCWCGRP